MTINEKYIGSDFEDFLEEEGILQEVTEASIKRVLAFQIKQEMEHKGLSKAAMAKKMNTSRPSLDRLLNPDNAAVTLKTMMKAATVLGRSLRLELA
jgi:predicted XRE-type DNA-binding protein